MVITIMRKKKVYNLFNKIRAALRDIYRYSPMRKETIKAVIFESKVVGKAFTCPKCEVDWPIQMADVDHEPPLGPLIDSTDLKHWVDELFYGSVQVICKLCHKKKTAQQRRKK